MKEFDIAILGGGPGGYVAAIKGAQMGAKVALIEKGELGGVCLNWGCIPTKALLKSAKLYDDILKSEKYGIDIVDKSTVSINWSEMLNRKNKVVKQLTSGVENLLKRNGVEVFAGEGRIIDKNTLIVNDHTIKTQNLIIATGASTFIPQINGIQEAIYSGIALTSKEILELSELPKSLIVMGGGVIATEFAILFNTLGVDVTMVQRSGSILKKVDKDVSEEMLKVLKSRGIEVLLNSSIKSISGNTLKVKVENEEKNLVAEKMLVSLGNMPNVKGLENLGIDIDKKGIVTNNRMETNIRGIYAIGDVNGKYNLAHVASAEGIVAVENIMGKASKINYNRVPSCIYGFPEVATAGLTEEEARKEGYELLISTFPVSANGKALAEGESEGFIKIVAEKKYGEVLGVHIVAAHATDMISEAVTTMELEGTVHELAKAIHPHPTLSEIMMEAAHGAIDKPIHIFR